MKDHNNKFKKTGRNFNAASVPIPAEPEAQRETVPRQAEILEMTVTQSLQEESNKSRNKCFRTTSKSEAANFNQHARTDFNTHGQQTT